MNKHKHKWRHSYVYTYPRGQTPNLVVEFGPEVEQIRVQVAPEYDCILMPTVALIIIFNCHQWGPLDDMDTHETPSGV